MLSATLLELFGLVMIIAGAIVLLRAVAAVRPELVARAVGVGLNAGPTRLLGTRSPGSSSTTQDASRVRSFEEEWAALNDQMGPPDK